MPRMNEYDVSFYAMPDGRFTVDIHGSSGTTPFLTFPSAQNVPAFFESLGLSPEKLAEIESICSKLAAGYGYHEKMFLPEECLPNGPAKAAA
ncbi:MAG: hypothetical protein JO091_09350 [Acidobacteriaceae bacterium]|nr:hypothetical protein [Acidobacteriaceae bacterium]